MQTRRQKLITSILLESHQLALHPSPAQISAALELRSGHKLGGVKAIRAELMRLILDGTIREIETHAGPAPNRYALRDCPCPFCAT